MKKHSGRVRWVKFEGDCYASVEDIIETFEKHNNHPIVTRIIDYFKSLRIDFKNSVRDMPDEMKKDWSDIMKPN